MSYKEEDMIFSVEEFIARLLKYLIEGLMVGIAAFVIPSSHRAMKIEEIILIGLTAAATFSILDTFAPAVGATTRSGAGLGIGAKLVGFP